MELYRLHRPTNFKDVLGCKSTVTALENMVKTGTVPHVILLHGPSGCGKTSIARILKDELDCHDLDFREMNSANYRGIDSIRDIQRNMNLAPQGGPVRVWLLDEVHMLSKDASNAALKMWEDMPPHVYFFLCTTDPDKLLPAVRSRCCNMPVKLLNSQELASVATRVLKKEKITFPDDTLQACIDAAEGSARVLLVMLDKLRNVPHAQHAEAIEEAKAVENEAIDLCKALIDKKPWPFVSNILKNLKGEPESIRHAVMGFARWKLLKDGSYQAYIVLDCFKNNFYDTKHNGLALACFEAIQSK